MGSLMLPGAPPFPAPDPGKPPLRIGLEFSDHSDYPFFAPIFEVLERLSFTEPVLAVRVPPSGASSEELESALGNLYRHLDDTHKRRILAMHRKAATGLLARLPVVDRQRPASAASDREPPLDLGAYQLDLLLRCTFDRRPPPKTRTRYGTWRIEIEGQQRYTSMRLVERQPLTNIRLLADVDNDHRPQQIGSSTLNRPKGLSLVGAAEVEGRAAAEMLAWALWKLHAHGFPAICSEHVKVADTSVTAVGSSPNSVRLLRAMFARLRDGMANRRRPPAVREWQIGIRRADAAIPWKGSWENFRWIEAASGHYLADPFLIQNNQTTWLFAEDYDYEASKGRLVCAPLDSNGIPGSWTTVLDLPHHLSYPYVFEHDGEFWMIPESGAGGSVELYRATRFPDRWTHVRRLWDGAGLDTIATVAEDGHWYFFTSVQSSNQLPPQLLLFYAPDLLSPWSLHPSSPIALDIRFGRNGGRIRQFPDAQGIHRLFRVSQDGTGRYGSQLRFSRIVELNAHRYREVPCGERLPPQGRAGAHHHERHADWEVIDTARLVSPNTAHRQ